MDYLEKNNLAENTIIVYTSDQGFYMGEHNWFDKRFMYEESFRTPLVMRYPKAIKPGTKTDALVQNIDFAPTFLSLAGVRKPEQMSGTSLEPLFAGTSPTNWRKSLYYHYYDYPAFHMVRKHDGVRTEKYKLIHFYGPGGLRGATSKYQTTEGTREHMILNLLNKAGYIADAPDINCNELYDLENDPYEMNNLYGKPGYEQTTADMQALLDKYRKDLKVDEY
jgi:arylsulfatase A-like enzyme